MFKKVKFNKFFENTSYKTVASRKPVETKKPMTWNHEITFHLAMDSNCRSAIRNGELHFIYKNIP